MKPKIGKTTSRRNRMMAGYQQLKETLIEVPHLRAFQKFYRTLERKENIFYLFFTSNLLHWVRKCIAFVPEEVNLVLLGSHLSDEEVKWIRAHTQWPFHHVRRHVDDKSIWRFLFETNEYHFGWLDVDCFVMNPDLFKEMIKIQPPQVKRTCSMNTIWSFRGYGKLVFMSTFLLFVNCDVLKEIKALKLGVSPHTYSLHYTRLGRHAPDRYSRMFNRRQLAYLVKVCPTREDGGLLPNYTPYWDTLQVYQLIALAQGYDIRLVRKLWGTLPDPMGYSEEIIHIGMASHVKKRRPGAKKSELYNMHLQFRYLLLRDGIRELPGQYKPMLEGMADELRELGLDQRQCGSHIATQFQQLGIDQVLNTPNWAFVT